MALSIMGRETRVTMMRTLLAAAAIALTTGQAEGIGFSGNRNGYMTNERTVANNITFVEQSVRWFDFGEWIPESTAAAEPGTTTGFQVYPNPFSDQIRLRFAGDFRPDALRVLDAAGLPVVILTEAPETLDTQQWPKGLYLVEARQADGRSVVRRVVKN